MEQIEIRDIKESDIEAFYDCLKTLDSETEYMMYEPDERTFDEEEIRSYITDCKNKIFVACHEGEIAGYIVAEKSSFRRLRHSAYIVIGIRKRYGHRGIGTRLFELIEEWALENGITRRELTVETVNEAAVRLYKKCGCKIEGLKEHSMLVNGQYVDEYYMGKLLENSRGL